MLFSDIMREYMETYRPSDIFTGEYDGLLSQSTRMADLVLSNRDFLVSPQMDMHLSTEFAKYANGGRYWQLKTIGCLDDTKYPLPSAGANMVEDFLTKHGMNIDTAPEDILTLRYIMLYQDSHWLDLSKVLPSYALPYVETIRKINTLITATSWYAYVSKDFKNNEKRLSYRYGVNPKIWKFLEKGEPFDYLTHVESYEDYLLFLLGSTLRGLRNPDENIRKLVKSILLDTDTLMGRQETVFICMIDMISRYLSTDNSRRAMSLLISNLHNIE